MKESKQGKEVVDHPNHYKPRVSKEKMKFIIDRIVKRGYLEAIDVIEAWNLNFNLGSNVKYVLRCGEKDDEITELEKSDWYIKEEIAIRKSERNQ